MSDIFFFVPSKIAVLLVTPYSCRLRGSDARVAMPWDGFRTPKRHSFSRKRKNTAGALRIPLLRSLARSRFTIDRDSLSRVVGAERIHPPPFIPPSGGSIYRILRASEISHPPFLFPSLFLSRSISVLRHGVPQNITRSRHSFFTVDRRRGPRDNNGGEERFATTITLTGERSPSSSSAPLGPSCSLTRLEGGRRVGLAG